MLAKAYAAFHGHIPQESREPVSPDLSVRRAAPRPIRWCTCGVAWNGVDCGIRRDVLFRKSKRIPEFEKEKFCCELY